MKYTVTVNGTAYDVETPQKITFDRPLTDDEARDAIAKVVADGIAPRLADVPPHKEVQYNAAGRIARITEHAGIPAAALAEQVGREVARLHLALANDPGAVSEPIK